VPLFAEGDREVEGSVITLDEQRHVLARFLSQLAQLSDARHGGVIQSENHIARPDPSLRRQSTARPFCPSNAVKSGSSRCSLGPGVLADSCACVVARAWCTQGNPPDETRLFLVDSVEGSFNAILREGKIAKVHINDSIQSYQKIVR
jgi:hypothetical protein